MPRMWALPISVILDIMSTIANSFWLNVKHLCLEPYFHASLTTCTVVSLLEVSQNKTINTNLFKCGKKVQIQRQHCLSRAPLGG